MKIRLLTTLLIGLSLLYACDSETSVNFPSKIIQDSRVSDSVYNLLLDDAKLICLDFFTNEEMDELNKIEINELYIAPIYAALQMVYLDSISLASLQVKEYDIHTLCPIRLHQTTINVDSTNQYIASWKDYLFSDYIDLDLLIREYDLQLDSISSENYLVRTEKGINQEAMAGKLREIPFIRKANANNCIGDGSHIEIVYFDPDYIQLIYSYGWGDCPSGCINRHYWEFGIYGSGMIELLSEYGKDLPSLSIEPEEGTNNQELIFDRTE